jgi:glycerophosphoryl diester phosphodiesterase
MSRRSPLVLAHRGARRDAPENTLLAFERGLAQGADGFELDVRLTADDVLIVLHDTNTRRVAPSQPVLRAESSCYAALAGVSSAKGSGSHAWRRHSR